MKKLLLIIALLLPLPPLQAFKLSPQASFGAGILAATGTCGITAGVVYAILKKKNDGQPLTKKEKAILAVASFLPFIFITGGSGIHALSKLFANNENKETKNQTPPQQLHIGKTPPTGSSASRNGDQPTTGTIKNGAKKTAKSESFDQAKKTEIPQPQEQLPTPPTAEELAQQETDRKAREEQAKKDRLEKEKERLEKEEERKQQELEEAERQKNEEERIKNENAEKERLRKQKEDEEKKRQEEADKQRLEDEKKQKEEQERLHKAQEEEEKERLEKEEQAKKDREEEQKRLEEERKKKEAEEKQKAEEEEQQQHVESMRDALKALDLDKIKQLASNPFFTKHKKSNSNSALKIMVKSYIANATDPVKQAKADEAAKFFIQNGANLCTKVENSDKRLFDEILDDRYGSNGMQPASYFEKISLIKKMVDDWGLNLSAQEKAALLVDNANFQVCHKDTPLTTEEKEKNRQAIDFLKNDLKANINDHTIRNLFGEEQTVLGDAITSTENKKDLIKVLIELGADATISRTGATTPLHLLVSLNTLFGLKTADKLEIAQLFLEKGADINVRDDEGRTPLMTAVRSKANDLQLIEFLLENGADKTARDKNGESLMHQILPLSFWGEFEIRGMIAKRIECIKLLQSKGLDINDVIPQGFKHAGCTPLALAKKLKKSPTFITCLISCGAKE